MYEDVSNKVKTIPLKRLVPGLIIGPASWLGPYIVMSSLFLPAMLQQLDSVNKVQILAMFSTLGMIVAAISNMVAGSLSDRTRSRFGSRTPWSVSGSIVFMLAMIGASMSPNVWILLFFWMIGQIALNFIIAPMVAWLDMAPEGGKATASAAYGGLGMALGNNGFNIIGAMFLSQFKLGFIIFGIITFIGTMLAAFIVHEPSNLDDEKIVDDKQEKRKLNEALKLFPSWSVGRDYYLALLGKLFQGVGNFAVTGYLLYIMTDFLGKNGSATQSGIQLINMIMLIFGILMGFIAGPLADKFKLVKYPVAVSALLLAIGAISMFVLRNDTGLIIYAFMAGLGMGLWNSLDNLLNLSVIPDRSRVAFFLGVYNLGNTITQALAPVLVAIVIPIFGYSGIFIMSFVFALLASVLIMFIRSVKR